MTAAYFEDHPTDPDKVILRKKPMQSSVDKAVNGMTRQWVGLTWDDLPETAVGDVAFMQGAKWAEAKLKEKNT